jgi:predicted RNA-binding Zn-ribbon protein involved in translation (DUF1610 family)
MLTSHIRCPTCHQDIDIDEDFGTALCPFCGEWIEDIVLRKQEMVYEITYSSVDQKIMRHFDMLN